MKQWLEKYFGFSEKEMRGLFFLLIIIGVLSISPIIYSFLFPIEAREISEKSKQEIRLFLANTVNDRKESPADEIRVNGEIEYIDFDPNELSLQLGKRIGLSHRQIQMIQNYVAKGGHFYKKEDFQKIYAISKADYERLAPYIKIPAQHQNVSYSKKEVEAKHLPPVKGNKEEPITKLHIELNSTDSIALQKLRGIGPVFASRIVRFRNSLGGFHHVSQLMEVYGMDKERYEPLLDHIFVDTTLVKKIDINHADFKLLNKHPFITYKQANAIIQYRKQHGKYEKADDLLNILILDEDFLHKIAPYLFFSK